MKIAPRPNKQNHSLRFQALLFAAIRTVFNTLHRMVYPFLPTFSRSLGVGLPSLSLALTYRSIAGAGGPFLATVADRWGRKTGMLFGTTLFTIAAMSIVIWPTFPTFVIMLILANLGKYGFDPAMQAYFGDRIPYEQRGLMLAITELGWSLSFILGIPLMSLLIARQGWRSPFLALGLMGVLSFGVLLQMIPSDNSPQGNQAGMWSNFADVFNYRTALAGLGMAMAASTANEVINLVFGVWMEDSFGLKIIALGGTAAVIGFAELGGEMFVGALVDRIGKTRSITVGLLLNCAAALAMPLLGKNLLSALVLLFSFYITYEFTMVSLIPLMTEVMPTARATMMSFNAASISLGRAGGALLASTLYSWGMVANAAVTVIFNLIALLALHGVRKALH